jgi:hypothetical protein
MHYRDHCERSPSQRGMLFPAKFRDASGKMQTFRSYSSPRRSASASVMTSPRYRHINIPFGIGRHVRTPIVSPTRLVYYPILSFEF